MGYKSKERRQKSKKFNMDIIMQIQLTNKSNFYQYIDSDVLNQLIIAI